MPDLADLGSMPLRGLHLREPTHLDSLVRISKVASPTEVDYYLMRRVVDIYVASKGEALNSVYAAVEKIIHQTNEPKAVLCVRLSPWAVAPACARC
jgi:hypothetical protein